MRKLLLEITELGGYKITEDGKPVLQQDPANLGGEATLLIREDMNLHIREVAVPDNEGPADDWAPDVMEAIHEAARGSRPSIVVEWRDGLGTFYPLRHGIAFEDNDRRLLIIKAKELGEDGRETGAQDFRTVIPFEVLRGWYVYPRLDAVDQSEPIAQEVMHEALPDGKARCGFRGSRWSTEDAASVTCQACLVAMPKISIQMGPPRR